MAEQCSENSNATPSNFLAAKWWPDVHASSICSWPGGANYASNPSCDNPQDPNSNCSNGEEDASISTSFTTKSSNNSGLSMESSRRLVEKASSNDPYGEAVSDNHHLWNQVLLGARTTGELQNMSNQMFEPAYDYRNNIDSGWEFSNQTNHNQFQKNFNGFNDGLYQSKNPPDVEITPLFDQYDSRFTSIKNEQPDGLFRRELNNHKYQEGINNKLYYNGMSDMECTNGRGSVDLGGFGSCLNKSPEESNMPNKSMVNAMNLPGQRKPSIYDSYHPIKPRGSASTSTPAKTNGRGNGVANEGKRKTSEDQSGSLVKKTKLETSTVSATKTQLPKAKLGDKITALQQIVSPFGKTDTASVLWEAMGYIKCLQDQVQLLSNPYMKTNIIKETWGRNRMETNDRGDMKHDLTSRGLCLVPVSCTPQVYHENNGSDYWTPTYRGYFYG